MTEKTKRRIEKSRYYAKILKERGMEYRKMGGLTSQEAMICDSISEAYILEARRWEEAADLMEAP